MRIILSWALWRRPRAEREILVAAAQAAQADVNRQKEVSLMGQTIAEAIWEEGRSKGQGEGELSHARRMLRQLLTRRFGPLPEDVLQRIEAATDVERLTASGLEVLSMEKLDDLQL
jgi:hypothetical protein